MTRPTQGNYIKPMFTTVTVVVMVIKRLITALVACQVRCVGQPSIADSTINGAVGLRRSRIVPVPSFDGYHCGFLVLAFVPVAVVVTAFPVVRLAMLGALLPNVGPISVFLFSPAHAFFTVSSMAVAGLGILPEIIQRLNFTASSTSFFGHKNASCRLGVSTFA